MSVLLLSLVFKPFADWPVGETGCLPPAVLPSPPRGGEGKTAGGRHPVSPTGQSAKGLKTRDNKRTDKFIVKRRNKRKDTK